MSQTRPLTFRLSHTHRQQFLESIGTEKPGPFVRDLVLRFLHEEAINQKAEERHLETLQLLSELRKDLSVSVRALLVSFGVSPEQVAEWAKKNLKTDSTNEEVQSGND